MADEVKAAAERLLEHGACGRSCVYVIREQAADTLTVARAIIAAAERVERLEAALIPLLDEFGARLSDGKPIGYTVGSMNRALRMIAVASDALAVAPDTGEPGT